MASKILTATDLGLTVASPRAEFLGKLSERSEGKATCRFYRDNAMIIFVGVPGVMGSGAIYLYTRRDGDLWLLDFPIKDSTSLTMDDCERLFNEYHLSELAYNPTPVFPPRAPAPARRRHQA